MAGLRVAVVVMAAMVSGGAAQNFEPQRIMFAKCDDGYDTVKPLVVYMTCAALHNGVCDVRKGGVHSLRAIFRSEHASADVESYVRWNRFISLGLPDQEPDACKENLACPVQPGEVTRFTYHLPIQDFFPAGEYPIMWSLTDRATDTDILCFKFKINIV